MEDGQTDRVYKVLLFSLVCFSFIVVTPRLAGFLKNKKIPERKSRYAHGNVIAIIRDDVRRRVTGELRGHFKIKLIYNSRLINMEGSCLSL
jgi:hypothetical protein